jgi:hypothetical protein
MNYAHEIEKINERLDTLQASILQMQKNLTPVTAKTDDTSNRVDALTPYTETKTAYIGDSECVFTGVPSGNMSVFIEDSQIAYGVSRDSDRVTVDFIEPLEEVTTVTISIM